MVHAAYIKASLSTTAYGMIKLMAQNTLEWASGVWIPTDNKSRKKIRDQMVQNNKNLHNEWAVENLEIWRRRKFNNRQASLSS